MPGIAGPSGKTGPSPGEPPLAADARNGEPHPGDWPAVVYVPGRVGGEVPSGAASRAAEEVEELAEVLRGLLGSEPDSVEDAARRVWEGVLADAELFGRVVEAFAAEGRRHGAEAVAWAEAEDLALGAGVALRLGLPLLGPGTDAGGRRVLLVTALLRDPSAVRDAGDGAPARAGRVPAVCALARASEVDTHGPVTSNMMSIISL